VSDRSTGGRANRETVVDHLVEVWTSLVASCDGIRPGQWDLGTDCPGWTVKDQLAHVIGVERMVMGEGAPPPLGSVPDHVRNEFAALNEQWIEARRQRPGSEVLAELVAVTERRTHALRSLPADRFDVMGWGPAGQVPYREFLTSRVLDGWVHEQDVRRALGRPGGRNGAGEATALDRCADTMAYVVGKRVGPPDGTVVCFTVTGVLGRQLPVFMSAGRAAVAPASGPPRATTTLTMDQETFWRLGFGRVDPAKVLAAGQVRVGGEHSLGHRVLESMAFMI
jgi:uncharacterized protein (TIGR03083 family)